VAHQTGTGPRGAQPESGAEAKQNPRGAERLSPARLSVRRNCAPADGRKQREHAEGGAKAGHPGARPRQRQSATARARAAGGPVCGRQHRRRRGPRRRKPGAARDSTGKAAKFSARDTSSPDDRNSGSDVQRPAPSYEARATNDAPAARRWPGRPRPAADWGRRRTQQGRTACAPDRRGQGDKPGGNGESRCTRRRRDPPKLSQPAEAMPSTSGRRSEAARWPRPSAAATRKMAQERAQRKAVGPVGQKEKRRRQHSAPWANRQGSEDQRQAHPAHPRKCYHPGGRPRTAH